MHYGVVCGCVVCLIEGVIILWQSNMAVQSNVAVQSTQTNLQTNKTHMLLNSWACVLDPLLAQTISAERLAANTVWGVVELYVAGEHKPFGHKQLKAVLAIDKLLVSGELDNEQITLATEKRSQLLHAMMKEVRHGNCAERAGSIARVVHVQGAGVGRIVRAGRWDFCGTHAHACARELRA